MIATTTQHKIARAAEKCLALMDGACEAAALVEETEFISKLQSDGSWTEAEIREVQKWVKAARKTED